MLCLPRVRTSVCEDGNIFWKNEKICGVTGRLKGVVGVNGGKEASGGCGRFVQWDNEK